MPFGLHTAPATFQRLLDQVIGPDMEPRAFAYLDDRGTGKNIRGTLTQPGGSLVEVT